MSKLVKRRIVIAIGALAAALAGLDVGAATRPAAARAGHTLGPRMDFDLAAHAAPAPIAAAEARDAAF